MFSIGADDTCTLTDAVRLLDYDEIIDTTGLFLYPNSEHTISVITIARLALRDTLRCTSADEIGETTTQVETARMRQIFDANLQF